MRGSIKQRTKGSYELKYDIGYDENGVRQQRSRTIRGSKRKAEEEMARIEVQVADGTYVDERRQKKGKTNAQPVPEAPITVAGLMERFLSEQKETVGDSWNRRMRMITRCHINPTLGDIPLKDLTPVHIRDWIDAQLEGGGIVRQGRPKSSSHEPGEPLERQTVLHHSRLLRQALEMAVDWDLIQKNPAKTVKLPKPEEKEMVALTEEQVEILLMMVKDSWLFPLVMMAVHVGARRSELVTMKWSDIDWEERRVLIQRSAEKDDDGNYQIKGPKTKAGKRHVTLSKKVMDTLRKQKGLQAQQRLACGPTWKDEGWVFTNDDGTMLDPDRISQLYYRFWQQPASKGHVMGLPRHRFHDLRHTCVSLLLHQGLDIKLISTIIGHASVSITLDRYAHLMPGSGEKVAEAMDKMFGS
jgi:integrase